MKNPDNLIENEQKLLQRIARGEKTAEQELLKRHAIVEKIEMMVYTRLNAPKEDKDDLVGKILLNVILNLRNGRYNPQKGDLNSYIWGIARNKIKDYLEKSKHLRHQTSIENIQLFTEADYQNLEIKELRRELRKLINQLDWKYQEVLLLKFYQELSTDEIAELLEISRAQVYNRFHYALKLLQESYEIFKKNQNK